MTIAIIGAGPAGLWQGIQLKLRNPNLDIILFEKYEMYQRSHVLRLEPSSFEGSIRDNKGILENLIKQLKRNDRIKTNHLEEILLDLAKELGIEIKYQQITNIQKDILNAYPKTAMIIGADGVRSTVNQQIFGPDNKVKIPLKYAAHIKYTVAGNATPLSSITELYPLLKKTHYLADIHVGKIQEGQTPVTIQILIDEKAYNNLKNRATFKNPIYIFGNQEVEIPDDLLSDIKIILGHSIVTKSENIRYSEVKLNVTELPEHHCQQVIKRVNGVYYCLIGDAQLGLSFFKGLNSAIKSGTELANNIHQNISKTVRIHPRHEKPDFDKLITGTIIDEKKINDFAAYIVTNKILSHRVRLFNAEKKSLEALTPIQGISLKDASLVSHLVKESYPFHDYAIWYRNFADEKITEGKQKANTLNAIETSIKLSNLPSDKIQALKYHQDEIESFKRFIDLKIAHLQQYGSDDQPNYNARQIRLETEVFNHKHNLKDPDSLLISHLKLFASQLETIAEVKQFFDDIGIGRDENKPGDNVFFSQLRSRPRSIFHGNCDGYRETNDSQEIANFAKNHLLHLLEAKEYKITQAEHEDCLDVFGRNIHRLAPKSKIPERLAVYQSLPIQITDKQPVMLI